MGKITQFIIKIGATGSTARWVGKHYLRLRIDSDSITDTLGRMVEFRYERFNIKDAKNQLSDRLSYLDNLSDFTFSILQLEGAINSDQMSRSIRFEVSSVIQKELGKLNLPREVIIGSNII